MKISTCREHHAPMVYKVILEKLLAWKKYIYMYFK